MIAANKRLVVVIGATLLLAIAYWFLLLSPKQSELSVLDDRLDQLHLAVNEADAEVAAGRAAENRFGASYTELITLGKAVPDGDEQAALMYQLNRLGDETGTFFTSISLQGSGAPEPAGPATAPAPTLDGELEPSVAAVPGEGDVAPPPTSAAPVDAAVAALPIGAVVGEGELATLPYQLSFDGDFFQLADFIASIDSLVRVGERDAIAVNGRLMTIDGFALEIGEEGGLDELAGSFSITTFVTPAREGLTAGATPTGPGPGESVPAADIEAAAAITEEAAVTEEGGG